MKRNFSLNNKSLAIRFAAILLAMGSFVSVANAAGEGTVQTVGGVPYVSGGVGTESIDRLNALASQFDVKLVFALKAGDYLSGIGVTIADSTGRKLLDTTSKGPWFMAQLPAGNYQVVATFAGKAQTRQVAVVAAKLTTIDFRWASE